MNAAVKTGRQAVAALLVAAACASAGDPGTRKTAGGGWEFSSGFEKPAVRSESYAMLPVEFSIAFYVGDQDQRFYGLTRAHSHSGRQSLYLDLGNNGGPAGFGASGVIKEFPVERLPAGTRFEAEGWMASDPDHPLRVGKVNLRLEFYGPTSQTLLYKTEEDAAVSAHAAMDGASATTSFNRYFLSYTVGPETIPQPEKIRLVKFVVGGNSEGNSGSGRALIDDVSLTVTPPPAP